MDPFTPRSLVVVGSFVLLAISHDLYTRWKDRRNRLPPGPTPIPFFGNVLQLPRANHHLTLQQWGKKFGNVTPTISMDFVLIIDYR